MEQNKVRSYFLYAIGEIALVMIGILLALQVNNWNEERKDRQLEKVFTERLIQDFKNDTLQFNNSIRNAESRIRRAEVLLNSVNDPVHATEDPSFYIISVERAGYTTEPEISRHTFDEMKSSGLLSLIRDIDLRTQIATYYSWIEKYNQYNFIREEMQLTYIAFVNDILSAEQKINMGSYYNASVYTPEEALKVRERILATPEYIEWLPNTIASNIRTAERMTDYKAEAEVIIQNLLMTLNGNQELQEN